MSEIITHRTMAGIRSPLTSIARSVMGQGPKRSFPTILTFTDGATTYALTFTDVATETVLTI